MTSPLLRGGVFFYRRNFDRTYRVQKGEDKMKVIDGGVTAAKGFQAAAAAAGIKYKDRTDMGADLQ